MYERDRSLLRSRPSSATSKPPTGKSPRPRSPRRPGTLALARRSCADGDPRPRRGSADRRGAIEPADPCPSEAELREGRVPITHGGIVGQVWRNGARQAMLARLLAGIEIAPIDDDLGRRAGTLLARSSTDDVHDAAVVLLAFDGDQIVTSDLDDLTTLAAAYGVHVEIVPV